MATDTGYGDDPQFQAIGGGESCTLAKTVDWVQIPIAWRYLFPWEILPDPSPENVARLASEVSALVAGGELSRPLVEVLEASTFRVAEAIR